MDCDEEYTGESFGTFGESYKSPIYEHQSKTGYNAWLENLRIVGREGHNLLRSIKESIYIKIQQPPSLIGT